MAINEHEHLISFTPAQQKRVLRRLGVDNINKLKITIEVDGNESEHLRALGMENSVMKVSLRWQGNGHFC